METVSFKPSGNFRKLSDRVFEEQKQRIKEMLPFAEIHHIGGTIIPKLVTKGDLDINVRIDKNFFDFAVKSLKRMYGINQPENWTNTFASFKDDTHLEISLGVQLTVFNSLNDNFIKQRDLLLKYPNLAKELNVLKSNYDGKSMDEYRKAKGLFFEKIITNKKYRL